MGIENLKALVDDMLTLDEVCDVLKVSKKTVWRWRKSRGFPTPINLNGKLLFDESDVTRWFEYQKILSEDEVTNGN